MKQICPKCVVPIENAPGSCKYSWVAGARVRFLPKGILPKGTFLAQGNTAAARDDPGHRI